MIRRNECLAGACGHSMEQHFVQASPIEYLAAFFALGEVFLVFGRQLFVFVECLW
jgi:hypothetical protein